MVPVGPKEQELWDAAARILAMSDTNPADTSAEETRMNGDIGGMAQARCQLIAPTGDYEPSHGTIALFQPSFAKRLSAGIKILNDQGITPAITDGYRTQAMQDARRGAARSGASPYGAAQGISHHQIGMAADFGPNNDLGNDAVIRAAMTSAGLRNGTQFHPSDPVHYYVHPDAAQSLNRVTMQSCAAAFARMRK